MFKINDKGEISITRGDTGIFTLDISTSDGSSYDYSNDEVLFTVKRTVYDAEHVIQKRITYGENVTILPSDTSSLSYADYVFDVQVTTAGGIVDTVIPPSKFTVRSEVTF